MNRTLITVGYPRFDPFKVTSATEPYTNQYEFKQSDVLMLWGGEDISPELYGQKANKYVRASRPSRRDIEEWEALKKAVEIGIPILGICRGAQMMTAFTGGTLLQHINQHHLAHDLQVLNEEQQLKVNSCHHQMMQPTDSCTILAWASGTTGVGENNEAFFVEKVPEIIHFPQINGFGVQFHPEWDDCPQKTINWCSNKIKELLF